MLKVARSIKVLENKIELNEDQIAQLMYITSPQTSPQKGSEYQSPGKYTGKGQPRYDAEDEGNY